MLRTGRECSDSIRDGRQLFINGDRVVQLGEASATRYCGLLLAVVEKLGA